MDDQEVFNHQWPYVLSFLPQDLDLEESARETGALVRRREITSAESLLRLAMVYGYCGFSLRQTAAWAQTADVAQLSDVAVLKRLRKAAPWLGRVLGAKLAQRAQARFPSAPNLRVRLVDATTVSRPGSQGVDWRVHLGFDLQSLTVDEVQVTDRHGGEKLSRFAGAADELIVADRGYAHRQGMAAVLAEGGHFIVRLNWQNVPLLDLDGEPFDILNFLRDIPEAEAVSVPVQFASGQGKKAEQSKFTVRLVAVRKSEAAAEAQRLQVRKSRAKRQRNADPRTLESTGYTFVLTSVPEAVLNAAQVLEIYRFRWQIELAFKRLKSVLHLDELPAKDPDLAQTFLYAKLLAALLLEDFSDGFISISPWGFHIRATRKSLAHPADAVRSSV